MTTSTSDSTKIPHSHTDQSLRALPFRFQNLARIPALALIRLYQKTLSRTLPENTCRFYPSCSHYGYQAIYKYGLFRGGWMATWRILRCNPFNPGGLDPVPEELESVSDVWSRKIRKFLRNT